MVGFLITKLKISAIVLQLLHSQSYHSTANVVVLITMDLPFACAEPSASLEVRYMRASRQWTLKVGDGKNVA
ncbi:hypothetical protein CVT25_012984 [Psilocybe cyanescens]|uniref:Uncharacterized protein n=1 Tax=Psilocybe cyanescens TaxID=93625 RepID=A0A409X7M1_PSICY|nr:hypothetical protein CVT25_012984 [Psilocybe cyanescens]